MTDVLVSVTVVLLSVEWGGGGGVWREGGRGRGEWGGDQLLLALHLLQYLCVLTATYRAADDSPANLLGTSRGKKEKKEKERKEVLSFCRTMGPNQKQFIDPGGNYVCNSTLVINTVLCSVIKRKIKKKAIKILKIHIKK